MIVPPSAPDINTDTSPIDSDGNEVIDSGVNIPANEWLNSESRELAPVMWTDFRER